MPSVTTRVNESTVAAATTGAVNVGLSDDVELSVTAGPATWAHVTPTIASPFGSVPAPESIVIAPEATAKSEPALATGGSLMVLFTVTETLAEVFDVGSAPVQTNFSGVETNTDGLVKDGVIEAGLDRVTAGPSTWVHATVTGSASGSTTLPPSVTVTFSPTVWSGPASTTGGWLNLSSQLLLV